MSVLYDRHLLPMPESSQSSASGYHWRPAHAVKVAPAVAATLCQNLLVINSVGFLLGYYAMYNQWIQLGWFVSMTLAWFCVGGFQDFMQGLRSDRWLRALACLIFLLLARSSVIESPGMGIQDLWLGWFKTSMLMAVLMMLWRIGSNPRAARVIGFPLVATACASAIGSILIFYVFDAEAVFGMRLRNWFVYGGWNSVCTGLTFGFAAVWAVHHWYQASDRRDKMIWLLMAVILIWSTLMSMSRGALLALVMSHAALVLARGWRASIKPIALLLTCIVLFQVAAPIIFYFGARDISERLGVPAASVTSANSGDEVIVANPAVRMVERADSRRFEIYEAAFRSMTTWQDWLWGKGLWSANDFWSCSLRWNPAHIHSVFMDALVRGGIPTLLGLLAILGWGLCRAFVLAKSGDELWFMLACFGCGGLVFDGDSVFSLLSVPRFETLVLWVPLVIASARYTALRHNV